MAPEKDRSDPRHHARKHPSARADWTRSGSRQERGSRRRRRVPILVYHHVYHDDAPELQQSARESGAGVVAESQFLRQMQYVADAGWQVVSTTRMVEWLTADAALPDQALVLNFDNDWLDTFTVTLPILHRLGMVATCFPITDGVEAASQGEAATVRAACPRRPKSEPKRRSVFDPPGQYRGSSRGGGKWGGGSGRVRGGPRGRFAAVA